MNPDEIGLEQLAQEDALFPWLATDEMADEYDPESEEAYLDRLDCEGDNDF